jgi:serum/glucocorticoid-regulated kinase 2
VGTKIYKAPEMILKNGYNRAADLWTLGVYAYEMSNYSPPFSGRDITDRLKVKRLVQMAEKDRTWKNPKTSLEMKSFINDLLKFEPKDRLGVNGWDQLKKHVFFTSANFNWKALE